MANPIPALFKWFRKNRTEVKHVTEPVVEIHNAEPEQRNESGRNRSEELDALLEKLKDARVDNAKRLKRLGVVHKFLDTRTGDVIIVEPDDFETFDRLMVDKYTKIIYD